VQLIHAGGVIRIPPRLNVRSDELFAFLLDQVPRSGSRNLPEVLAKYCAQQEARFGPERVFSYRARPHRARSRRRIAIALCVASGLAGLSWIVAGLLLGKDREPWIVFGIFVAVFAGLFALAFRFESATPKVSNWRQSGLVIGPLGLALIQGEMRGELRWDELRHIRLGSKPGFFEVRLSGARLRGIDLVVEGATITIADLYDRPLRLIHARLLAYWQGQDANTARGQSPYPSRG